MRALRWIPVAGLFLSVPPIHADPVYEWSKSFGSCGIVHVASVASDFSDGQANFFVTGDFRGDVDFGGGSLENAGQADIFLAKFDAEGHLHWSRSFGDPEPQFGVAVATDASGSVIITGRHRGIVDFGGGPLTSAGDLADDVFIAKFDGNGNHLWSRSFGDDFGQTATSVAADGAGNIVVTGYYVGTMDFGGGPLTNDGAADIFLVKFDPDGNHLWSRSFGGPERQFAYSVATDESGAVVLAGSFRDTVDFGGGPLASAGSEDAFVAKFLGDGQHHWSRRFGDADAQQCRSVTMYDGGRVLFAGRLSGEADFGGGTLTSAGAADAFLVSYDGAGTHHWSRRYGSGGDQVGFSVAAAGSGELFVLTGTYEDTLDVGGGPLPEPVGDGIFFAAFDNGGNHRWSFGLENGLPSPSPSVAVDASSDLLFTGGFADTGEVAGLRLACGNPRDSFVAKFLNAGHPVWSRCFGDSCGSGWGTSVAVDGAENVLVTGTFTGSVDFGGGPLEAADPNEVYLASFHADGSHRWSRDCGGTSSYAPSVATDGSGNVHLAGYFAGTADFGGGPLASAGSTDAFIAKFDASGNHLWSGRFGDGSDQAAQSVATDGSGNTIVTGYFSGTIDFGGGVLTANGYDVFLAKFDASGNHLWSRRFGDGNHQWGRSVAADSAGDIVALGSYHGALDFGGGVLPNVSSSDLYIARFDPDGNHVWSRGFGASAGLLPRSVAMDSAGSVVITGGLYGTVDFGGGPIAGGGDLDIFLASFDADGNHRWSRAFGDAAHQGACSVRTDPRGNVFLVGRFSGTVDFGGGPLVDEGETDLCVASFDPGGSHRWSWRFGDGNPQYPEAAVATGGSGSIVLTGTYLGAIDFGGGPVRAGAELSVFLARFQDESVPVRIASFDASFRRGAVEIRWEVWSDESLEGFTLYRRDNAGAIDTRPDEAQPVDARSGDTFSEPVAIARGPLRRGVQSHVDARVGPGTTYRYELAIHTRAGEQIRSPIVEVITPPLRPILGQNYPNPFAATSGAKTRIEFSLAAASRAVLGIYDVTGRLVARLDQGIRDAGKHTAEWDGRDARGRAVESGVYFYRLEGEVRIGPRQLLLIR